jgi:RNA polymerase sigma factor (sigma-70 family)
MFQVARRVLNQRLQDAIESGKHAHVEEPPEDSQQWEDEPLNFYQPDESLRLEDLMRDSSIATPEEYLAEEETEERLQNAIAELPDEVREPFILYALEGFNSDEAAMILGKEKEEILDAVKHARKLLREQVESE